jgi:hypothetical protein
MLTIENGSTGRGDESLRRDLNKKRRGVLAQELYAVIWPISQTGADT